MMPNWCLTTMDVRGSESELKEFFADLEKAKEDADKNNVSIMYQLFINKGITEKQLDDIYFSRGDIEEFLFTKDNKCIRVYYDSAWTPNINAFDFLFNEKYKTLSQVSRSEEPECEIFVNTDKEHISFTEKWRVYISEEDEDGDEVYGEEYFSSDDEALAYLNPYLKTNFKTMDEVLDFVKDKDNIRINEYYSMQIRVGNKIAPATRGYFVLLPNLNHFLYRALVSFSFCPSLSLDIIFHRSVSVSNCSL